jgi:hypothetical protein
MKKYLIILLCLVGLSGCGYLMQNLILDPINDSVVQKQEDVYLLPSKNANSTVLHDKFSLREEEFSEYLQNLVQQGHDVKAILKNNGAECDNESCYFYFLQDVINGNKPIYFLIKKISLNKISYNNHLLLPLNDWENINVKENKKVNFSVIQPIQLSYSLGSIHRLQPNNFTKKVSNFLKENNYANK